jgi:Ca2+-binding RTX toxin-like protein
MAESTENKPVDTSEHVVGTSGDDQIAGGYVDAQGNTVLGDEGADFVNGNAGDDSVTTGDGNDLAAGDMVGNEWTFVNGKWIYNAAAISGGAPIERNYDDVIVTGDGSDVLLGNGGDDKLYAGSGDDLVNAGIGEDQAFGGDGSDVLNLEAGDDLGVGGRGADTINAGDGNDVVYGDLQDGNILQANTDGSNPTSFAQYEDANSGWSVSDVDGQTQMTQSVSTDAGTSYKVSFEVAANLAGGATSAKVEVMWNGEVVGEVEVTSGVYEKFEIDVPGVGGEGELTFREMTPVNTGPEINSDGPIAYYETEVTVGGEEVSVSAFAPGQAKLYQVIDGQLKVFDPSTDEYQDAGDPTGLGLNAIGFNVEDDLIYGIAKQAGVDALGNPVEVPDIVMVDAEGNAYRVGEAPYGDFVGDFDDSGNLWTFQNSLNRVTKVDVDNLDADGNPTSQTFDLPNSLFGGKIYDIAYSAADDCFYAVEAPGKNGGEGAVHRIEMSEVELGGEPTVTSLPITGTLLDGTMEIGMAKGAYGALFLDGDGNLYYGMNRGDHDFDGTTGSQGGIYGVNMDWEGGTAYAEFMAESESTGRNDGAVDPRSADAFAEVDGEATLLIRNPEVIDQSGGDDSLRGGAGDDTMFGGAGDDDMHGGADDDYLSGDAGNDNMFGGVGTDEMHGGEGNDTMHGGDGDDVMAGGADNDLLYGGAVSDDISGGAGDDKIYAGAGDDTVSGGDGNDRIYTDGGDNTVFGDAGNDTVVGNDGEDEVYGGDGADFILGRGGDDYISGGAGGDKLVGGKGSDTIEGGEGNDNMWGGEWSGDGSSDTFIVSAGSGKDMIHDFEADHDVVDLSSYGLEFSDLANLMTDQGWATEIDLSGLSGGQQGDKLILKSIDPDELDESNFIL